MNTKSSIYCLDANVLIEAWNKYYNPKICPDYWQLLDELGSQNLIFLPEMVKAEISKTENDLATWLNSSNISIYPIDTKVTECLKRIYASNPDHKFLVDNIKQRSLADPWLIAHAVNENACVVTKENKGTATNTKRIKIPNVCENMGVRWIDDFKFIEEMNIKFSCSIV